LRLHHLIADRIDLIPWNHIVDNAKTVAAKRIGATSNQLLDRIRLRAKGIGPGARQFGRHNFGVVGFPRNLIARLLQLFFQAIGFGV
jgi:hypothetical protein